MNTLEQSPLRIGFICGRADGDLIRSPGIAQAYCDNHKEEVCSDVALWHYINTHYPDIECDMIVPLDGDLTASRLQSNDINLLLGYDAVSAHIDEIDANREEGADKEWGSIGHGDRMTELLCAESSRVWPPGDVQTLQNLKSNYLQRAKDCGIPIAPTHFHTIMSDMDPVTVAAEIMGVVNERGWQKIVVKPVPSAWSRGVKTFETCVLRLSQETLVEYLEGNVIRKAKEILVQEYVAGLLTHPEVRAFFYGGVFKYCVANSKHKPQPSEPEAGSKNSKNSKNSTGTAEVTEVTESCESASDSTRSARHGRQLPSEFWKPARELSQRVQNELLPPLVKW